MAPPGITLTGLDQAVTERQIRRLLEHPHVELGLLLSYSLETRNRYPRVPWLIWAASIAAGRCAIHVCGRVAREALRQRELEDLVRYAARIQVNGLLAVSEVEELCALYPGHTILTQHHSDNDALRQVRAPNHALLVDASGGTGRAPDVWTRPDTDKAVGFAGGLGPYTLDVELPRIAAVAGDGAWWIDLETNLRRGDWFDPDAALGVLEAFDRWQHRYAGVAQGSDRVR